MKFDDVINMVLSEDSAEEDMFMDALDDGKKRNLVKADVKRLVGYVVGMGRHSNTIYWRKPAIKLATKLYTMTKKPFLRGYIEDELSRVELDMLDLEYIAKYGMVNSVDREEEKRKQRGLGNIR